VHTSLVKLINLKEKYILTLNSKYELGKISKSYLQFCIDNDVKDLDLLRQFE